MPGLQRYRTDCRPLASNPLLRG